MLFGTTIFFLILDECSVTDKINCVGSRDKTALNFVTIFSSSNIINESRIIITVRYLIFILNGSKVRRVRQSSIA